ncbi:cobalamin-independent methionine synthase II family protein [Roseiterribacter gracilis]|uniref:Methionine synthase n=1 Tax=Roseiterribacter gracilis TaxID=2812848 RepID=A0A8S8XCJ8_9PROT|nr:methionine synthase [Rhodospirillales bacterium TMPK1]
MLISRDRILTTHVGSLPRPADVTDLLFAEERGDPLDPAEFEIVVGKATREIVRRQRDVGIDTVSDGEMSKISYATYIRHRLTGFEGDSPRRVPADLEAYPDFMGRAAKTGGTPSYARPRCVGPIAVKTMAPLEADLRRFRAALDATPSPDAFMNAAAPGVIALFQPNEFYPDDDAYLDAIAAAMRVEYEAIARAGLVVQIDSPDLALGRHMMFKDRSEAAFLVRIERHIEVLNAALVAVPKAQVRVHVCWGNYEGPHHCDIELERILPTLLKLKAGGLSFEGANPRHAHEWASWTRVQVPDDVVLIPGVLDSTTNFVEHPQLVAERIERFASVVGRERVIAGSDCGFSTFAGFGTVHPEIAFAKLASLVEGAAIASERLWRQAA